MTQVIENLNVLRHKIAVAYREEESESILRCLNTLNFSKEAESKIFAQKLIEKAREAHVSGIEELIRLYDLSTPQGIVLMCLAEALLRIPDKKTQDLLIQEKLSDTEWQHETLKKSSLLAHSAVLGLQLTGTLAKFKDPSAEGFLAYLKRGMATTSQPVIRQAVKHAMKMLGQQFVFSDTIKGALKRAEGLEKEGFLYSYDRLGEAAKTKEAADIYFAEYKAAIEELIAKKATHFKGKPLSKCPSISIKLSALDPRYHFSQQERLIVDLTPKVLELAELAYKGGIGLTVDAEEADRLEISLNIFERLATSPTLKGWEGLGMAVQAYQKRALPLLEWLVALAQETGHRFMIRLVKGAYWDSEIKRTQELGLKDYPVYTRKAHTDLSYLAAAQFMLTNTKWVYPQFATHNALTIASVLAMAGDKRDFEFQCLHGMGENLYKSLKELGVPVPCRIYAPVGPYEDLLPYLVRRLLENGANSSFINQVSHPTLDFDVLLKSPIERAHETKGEGHPKIPLPQNLFGAERLNSKGLDLSDPLVCSQALPEIEAFKAKLPLTLKGAFSGPAFERRCPFNPDLIVTKGSYGAESEIKECLEKALAAFPVWSRKKAEERACILEKAADLMEERLVEFMSYCVYEAGKNLEDAVGEIREAVDFCRYYAAEGRRLLKEPLALKSVTGEKNELTLHGRGVFVCISPWNFPLAIFIGQVSAALMAGNTVLAKPASQTTLIAQKALELFYEAGLDQDVCQLLIAPGALVEEGVIKDSRIAGVAFTGSCETARLLNQALAVRKGPLIPFIAETGGLNAMIVDSSCLLEHAVTDIIQSAFQSAGQRCSALRLLLVQEDCAEALLSMLKGAMQELRLGSPSLLETDIGPVIDQKAQKELATYIKEFSGKEIASTPLPESTGTFIAPHVFEIAEISDLKREVFGPLLHVKRFSFKEFPKILKEINALGYGLTMGLQTRLFQKMSSLREEAEVGNLYINRNMIGAVVGVQPFGGEKLSGTGPKAGGPHYLLRFMTERVVTTNLTATGGNLALLSLEE